MKMLKYGSTKFLYLMTPFVIMIYIAMLMSQTYLLKSTTEIYPFFDWSLFSSPSKKMIKNYLKIESVDGISIEPKQGLISIGLTENNLQKSIKETLEICMNKGFDNCENEAIKLLSPFINKWKLNYKKIEFSIFRCYVDSKKVVTLMKQGVEQFPKMLDCQSKVNHGPWNIYK